MKRFNDATGKQWEIDVHLESIERVKDLHKIDLTQLFSNDMALLSRLSEDATTLANVLWNLQVNQGAAKSDFLKSLRGDSIESGFRALVEDVIDFFPNARRRELCRKTVEKLWQTVEAGQDLAEMKLEALNPTLLLSVTNSAESQESDHVGSD